MPLRELLDELLTSLETGPLITAVRHFDARPAVFAPVPVLARPAHRRGAAGARRSASSTRTRPRPSTSVAKGEHLVVVTPTASGKTLCYNLPVLQALVQQPEARVLYLFPTKALAQDQLAELTELAKSLPDMRMFTYDGDTPQDARRAVRARANLVLTNPDMLHSGILPHHTKWVNLFQNLTLRGDRRAARLPRRLRQPPRQRAAAAQAHLPPLRGSTPAVHHGLRHHRQPARAGRAAHRRDGGRAQRERRARRREDLPAATTRRW